MSLRDSQIAQKKSHGKHGNHGFFLNTYHTNQANLSRQNQETPFVLVKTPVFDAIASYFSSRASSRPFPNHHDAVSRYFIGKTENNLKFEN